MPLWVNFGDALAIGLLALAIFVYATGGFRERIGGVLVSVTSTWRPLLWALLITAARHVLFRKPALQARVASCVIAYAKIAFTRVEWIREACRRTAGKLGQMVLILGPGVLLIMPVVLYVAVPVFWQINGLSPLTGDEPHYLMIADAVIEDHSFNVFPAYMRDAEERQIAGPIDWQRHSKGQGDRWFSLHSIGLPLVVAPGFWLGGTVGVRVTMGLIAGLIPLIFFKVAQLRGVSMLEAAGLAFCASSGLPFVAASGQVYPDLPAGVCLLALGYFAARAANGHLNLATGAIASLLVAALPWLHLKNVLAAVVLGGTIIASYVLNGCRASAARTVVWIASSAAGSIVLLGLYNHMAFGSLAGPYDVEAAADATLRQATMIFAGLHLDQAQGVFIQQPLFLAGVAGLGLLLRRNPLLFFGLAGAYLAVAVPNSMHTCWYGCFSVSGRFMWSLAPLWYFPLVYLYVELNRRGRWILGAFSAAVVTWQASAVAWLFEHGTADLLMAWREELDRRNSLFDTEWRALLPSFYDFSSYTSSPANLVAGGLLAVLVAAAAWLGARWRAKEAREGAAACRRGPQSSPLMRR